MERANRQKQTDKLVFFSNLVLGSIAKKRMKRVGMNECMDEICDMSDGWLQMVSFSSTPFG
jgi:hypothetical protein